MPGRVKRIALLGAERTGKTQLAGALATALAAQGQAAAVVPEFLHEWCERHGRMPGRRELPAMAQEQARRVLAAGHAGVVIADTTPLTTAVYSQWRFGDASLYDFAFAHQQRYDLTLLTGLDLPWTAGNLQRGGPQAREPVDALLRSALARAGMAYQVVYGLGPQRLENALMAIHSRAIPVDSARATGQYKINAGRTAWSCESCSDPDCERRLFTGLLRA